MTSQQSLDIRTSGRGTIEITRQVKEVLTRSGLRVGLASIFLHHTSASLILCENADPDVRHDLETFLSQLVPDGDRRFVHRDEGPDDMPAHVRGILTSNSLCIPIREGRLDLGTWQGVYLYEHRHAAHSRRLTVTLLGE